MSPHVLMVVENLPVPRDRRVWNEATTLRDAGYDVTIISPAGQGHDSPEERIDGVRILRHPMLDDTGSRMGFFREYATALRWERRLVRQVWRERPFDVMHLSNPPDLLFLLALPYRRRGVGVVFDHHDLSPELYESKFGRRGAVHALLRLFEWLTYRNVDRVVTTNQSIREVALERGGLEEEHVRVVRNGPDPETFSPREPDRAVRRGRECLAVWVGHMGAQAGLEDVVTAAAELGRWGREEIHFMLIGDGPARDELRRRAAEQGVADRIEFTGQLFGDDLVRHMASCDIGLLTLPKSALGDHSTPTKTMEYMSLGLPVVQYDLLESRRTAADAALYARPGDPADFAKQIRWLADRPEAREELGRRGRERVVTELAWRHQAPRLVALYEDLLGPG